MACKGVSYEKAETSEQHKTEMPPFPGEKITICKINK